MSKDSDYGGMALVNIERLELKMSCQEIGAIFLSKEHRQWTSELDMEKPELPNLVLFVLLFT